MSVAFGRNARGAPNVDSQGPPSPRGRGLASFLLAGGVGGGALLLTATCSRNGIAAFLNCPPRLPALGLDCDGRISTSKLPLPSAAHSVLALGALPAPAMASAGGSGAWSWPGVLSPLDSWFDTGFSYKQLNQYAGTHTHTHIYIYIHRCRQKIHVV